MRFKHFIAENVEYPLLDVLPEIKKNCGPFLAEAGGFPMFRGIPKVHVSGDKTTQLDLSLSRFSAHPTDRPPRDSKKALGFNFMFNACIDAAFGIENVRRKTVYATGDIEVARRYGIAHFCFPAGPIGYFWSDRITDSFEDSNVFEERIMKAVQPHLAKLARPAFRTPQVKALFDAIAKRKWAPSAWLKYNSAEINEELAQDLFKILRPLVPEEDDDGQPFFPHFSAKTLLNHADEDLHGAVVHALEMTGKTLFSRRKLDEALDGSYEISFFKSSGYYLVPTDEARMALQKDNPALKSGDVYAVYRALLRELTGSRGKESTGGS